MTTMQKITRTLVLVLLTAFCAQTAFAQQSVNTTTLSSAVSASINAQGAGGSNVAAGPNNTLVLGSTSNILPGYEVFVDQEAMQVASIPVAGTVVVQRAVDGTKMASHASGATVYIGQSSTIPGSPFQFSDPSIGTCTATNEAFNLRINVLNGLIWSCTNGVWLNVVDTYRFVEPTACQSSVSGNATGTQGYTSLGTAPSIPVVQAQTSVTGTNTHYFMCTIPLPGRLALARATYVVDVQFYYGVQGGALGTQVVVLASGTMNAKNVFTTIAYPAPGASETATGLAEAARADTGTLTLTPAVASFNTGTTTAGEFFSELFTPAAPIPLATDRQQLQMTVSLLNTTTTATTTNSPGFLVHYRMLAGQ